METTPEFARSNPRTIRWNGMQTSANNSKYRYSHAHTPSLCLMHNWIPHLFHFLSEIFISQTLSNVVFKHFAITNCNIFIAAIGMEALWIVISFCIQHADQPNQTISKPTIFDQRKQMYRYVCMIFKADNVRLKWMYVDYISNAVSFYPQNFFYAANGPTYTLYIQLSHIIFTWFIQA